MKLSVVTFDAAYNNEPSLTAQEHVAAMIHLRSLETPEQRRRADRVTGETKDLPMQVRVKLAALVLTAPYAQLPADAWDKVFERQLQTLNPFGLLL